jgi:2-C-methyl-D-erythritol 4-phosphate cytidylyltransferase
VGPGFIAFFDVQPASSPMPIPASTSVHFTVQSRMSQHSPPESPITSIVGRGEGGAGTVPPMGAVWAIVVAAGSGSRFGDTVPKQFLDLAGIRLIDRALAAAGTACDGVVAVVPADHTVAMPAGVVTVAGGPSRSASVRAGLAAVPADADIVVVHDAARPLAGAELFRRVVAAVRAGADGAVPGVPVPDTIKRVDASGGRVVETLDRPALRAIQTPQAFSAAVLRRAHQRGGDATDDAALVEALGATVVVVDGDPANLKITGPEDLLRAEALLARRSG